MSTPRRQAESRKTYRCAVPGSRQEAVLSVGRRRIQVQLENESSGGFAAWCERDPRLKRDDEAYLHTALAKFEVRVAYVTEVGRARKQQLLVEVTRREIMSFLSDEQQERWRATFGF
jgi:hypothetical protein